MLAKQIIQIGNLNIYIYIYYGIWVIRSVFFFFHKYTLFGIYGCTSVDNYMYERSVKEISLWTILDNYMSVSMVSVQTQNHIMWAHYGVHVGD